jgi:hypothetical protein
MFKARNPFTHLITVQTIDQSKISAPIKILDPFCVVTDKRLLDPHPILVVSEIRVAFHDAQQLEFNVVASPPGHKSKPLDYGCMLALIRSVHTAIYIILAASVCLLFFAAITAYSSPLVIATAIAVAIEVVVFTANGFKCPLTGLAQKYGAEEFDTVLPARITRLTFRVFGTMLALTGLIYIVRQFWW